MLMSHYRSEPPIFIRFSNDWSMVENGDVSATHVTGIGRRLHYLPDAIYSESGQRNNPTEAKEL